MLPGKLLVMGVTVTALFFTGCAKKQKNSADLATQKSNTSTQSSRSNLTNSDDIFSEFYKDENSSSEKVTPKETFTPSGNVSESNAISSNRAEFSENGRYVLQVSTVRSHSFAQKIKNKLENAGFPAYVAEVENPTPALIGTYYRIRIGAFSTIRAARDFGENTLKSLGYDYWVDNKSNDMVGIDGSALGNSGSSYSNDSYIAPAKASSTESTKTSEQSDDWVTSVPAATTQNSASSTNAAPAASDQNTAQKNQTPQPVSNQSAAPATAAPVTSDTTDKDSGGWGSSGW